MPETVPALRAALRPANCPLQGLKRHDMHQAVRWHGVLWCAVAAAVTACAGGDQAGPTATVKTALPPTTTADPYAIPEVIDVAYVNRVLAGLDDALGEIARLVVRTRTIPPEVVERLRAMYTGEFLQLRIDRLQDEMRSGLSDYLDNPGNPKTTATQLITADATCIFAQVLRDYSAVSINATPPGSTLWVSLKPSDPSADPANFNPTAWIFVYDGFQPGRIEPPNPCAES